MQESKWKIVDKSYYYHLISLLFFFLLLLITTTSSPLSYSTKNQEEEYGKEEVSTTLEGIRMTTKKQGGGFSGARRRRVDVVEGSMPPKCARKCGACIPCNPVRVRVQPSSSISLTEYYPEAWRCRCGNKLFLP